MEAYRVEIDGKSSRYRELEQDHQWDRTSAQDYALLRPHQNQSSIEHDIGSRKLTYAYLSSLNSS